MIYHILGDVLYIGLGDVSYTGLGLGDVSCTGSGLGDVYDS